MDGSQSKSSKIDKLTWTVGKETLPLLAKSSSPVDTGWAWMVLIGTCFCHFIFVGEAASFGVLYVDIQEELDVSLVEVSIIGSLRNGFLFALVIFTSPLCTHIECRTICGVGGLLLSASFLICYFWSNIYAYFVFLGVSTGLSNAMMFSSSTMVINNCFDEHRPLAFVLTMSASGMGLVVFGPFSSYLLENYGLGGSLLIMAALALNCCVAALLYRPRSQSTVQKETISLLKDIVTSFNVYNDMTLLKDPQFYVLIASSFMHGFSVYIPLTLLTDHMVTDGIPLGVASLNLTVQGVSQTVVRVVVGLITNRFPWMIRILYITGGVIGGAVLFAIPFVHTVEEYMAFCAVFGFFYGCISAFLSLILVDLFGPERLTASFGITITIYGIAAVSGPPAASALAEVVHIRGIEYVMSGVILMAAGLILVPSLFTRKTLIQSA